MTIQSKEILTFEVYQRHGKMMIHLPMSNINPNNFILAENNLYIFVENQETYSLKNLNPRIVKHIHDGNCYIVESLDQLTGNSFLISI